MTKYAYYCGDDVLLSTLGLDLCPNALNLSRITKNSFTFMAVGNLDNDMTCDVWTIDDSKELKNVINDIRE